MADAARLDTNPDLTGPGRRHFPFHHFEQPGLAHLHGPISAPRHRRLLVECGLSPESVSFLSLVYVSYSTVCVLQVDRGRQVGGVSRAGPKVESDSLHPLLRQLRPGGRDRGAQHHPRAWRPRQQTLTGLSLSEAAASPVVRRPCRSLDDALATPTRW